MQLRTIACSSRLRYTAAGRRRRRRRRRPCGLLTPRLPSPCRALSTYRSLARPGSSTPLSAAPWGARPRPRVAAAPQACGRRDRRRNAGGWRHSELPSPHCCCRSGPSMRQYPFSTARAASQPKTFRRPASAILRTGRRKACIARFRRLRSWLQP